MRWILMLGCALTVSSLAHAEPFSMTFDAEDLTELDLRNSAGNVTIGVSESGVATVVATESEANNGCVLTMESDGSTLLVEAKPDTEFFPEATCRAVDFDITLPREIALDLQNGTGRIKVTGTSGPIGYQTGSGHVTFDGEITTLNGKSGSGTIEVFGLIGGGAVELGSGKIDLTYRQRPCQGRLDIKLGSGDIDVSLPAGSEVHTNFSTGSGSLTDEIGEVPDAAFAIKAVAGSGNLTIKRLP